MAAGILPVVTPPRGVSEDILANAIQRIFVANDVFVIIALPQTPAEGWTSNCFDATDVIER